MWSMDLAQVEASGVDKHDKTDHHRGQRLSEVAKGGERKAQECRRATVQGMTRVVPIYPAEM